MLKQHTASVLLLRSRAHLPTGTVASSSPTAPTRPSTDDPRPPLPTYGARTKATMATQSGAESARTTADLPPGVEQKQRPKLPGGPLFPLSYKAAAYQWWNSSSPLTAERNVLTSIPYLREASEYFASSASSLGAQQDAAAAAKFDPFGTRIWKTQLVGLSGKNRALNEYSIERVGEEVKETLVMLHGYGAGLGFFYKNYEPLSRMPGLKLYSLDMLGMGNSTRPPFIIHAKDQKGKIAEAESWFIDALEEWRIQRNIEKFTLLGHSLGGYLAVAYALKYPGRLNKLILASPAGVPANPYAVNENLPEPDESTMAAEFIEDQETVTKDSDGAVNSSSQRVKRTSSPSRSVSSSTSTSDSSHPQFGTNAPIRRLPPWFVWLWDANFSPFTLVRMTGPLGPRFVSGWSSRRFNHLPPDEAQALHDYTFAIFRQKGSGEYALAYLLAPGAFARDPVVNRIHRVGRQVISRTEEETIRETGLPIVMMYGENDWMDVAGGLASEQKLNAARRKALLNATEEERSRERGSAKVVVIQKAGHHLYLDNPGDFNEVIQQEMEETMGNGPGSTGF